MINWETRSLAHKFWLSKDDEPLRARPVSSTDRRAHPEQAHSVRPPGCANCAITESGRNVSDATSRLARRHPSLQQRFRFTPQTRLPWGFAPSRFRKLASVAAGRHPPTNTQSEKVVISAI